LKTIALQAEQVNALDHLATRVDRFNRAFGASLGRVQIDANLESNLKSLEGKAHLPEEAKKSLEEFGKPACRRARGVLLCDHRDVEQPPRAFCHLDECPWRSLLRNARPQRIRKQLSI
jgi:hypothetical protein